MQIEADSEGKQEKVTVESGSTRFWECDLKLDFVLPIPTKPRGNIDIFLFLLYIIWIKDNLSKIYIYSLC